MSGELSESLDPRQVANLMAGHLARAMDVDECAISYWDRAVGAGRVARLLPAARARGARAVLRGRPASPRRCASLERQEIGHRRRRGPIGRSGRGRAPAPRRQPDAGHAAARRQGPVDRPRRAVLDGPCAPDAERLEVARTMANEAAMALENARLYEDARKLADRDPLTGFYNHRFLHERLGEEVVRVAARQAAAERADARPRRLQARQRHVRPPVRRPGPDLGRGAHPVDACARRTCRPATAATSSRVILPDTDAAEAAARPSASSMRSATARSSASSAGRCRSRRRSAWRRSRRDGRTRDRADRRGRRAPSTRSSATGGPDGRSPRRRGRRPGRRTPNRGSARMAVQPKARAST